jgi:LPXTG-site transpeptidase (sortase) family protein
VTYAGVGSHSISAIYGGDANFLASTSPALTQTVGQDATTTALSSSANPSVSGQGVTFTATVSANPPGSGTPTGTVTFQDGGVNIAGCVNQPLIAGIATCAVTYAGAGSHSITAIYSGDARCLASTSGSVIQVILPGLPNTSGPQVETDAFNPVRPEDPRASIAMLALIAGLGALAIVARRLRGNHFRFRQRGRRHAVGALSAVFCLVVGPVAGSQLSIHPTGGSTLPAVALSPPQAAVAGLPAGTELIGDKLVTVVRPPPPAAYHFHSASGPILPSRLRIPSIGVDARVVGVGLLSNGSMDVPRNLWTTAWLSSGARPGQAGSSVIAGHRGVGSPAVFSHLENVQPHDRIYVSDVGGAELVYEVTNVVSVDRSTKTHVDVFGHTATSQLVVITCFGKYSNKTGTYDHRLAVFARLLPPIS